LAKELKYQAPSHKLQGLKIKKGGPRPQAPLYKKRVGPAHMLLSIKKGWVPPTCSSLFSAIPNRLPRIKENIGYVKKFIYLYTRKISCIMSLNILYKRYKQKGKIWK